MTTPWPHSPDLPDHLHTDHGYTPRTGMDLWHYLAHLAGDADHEHYRDEG